MERCRDTHRPGPTNRPETIIDRSTGARDASCRVPTAEECQRRIYYIWKWPLTCRQLRRRRMSDRRPVLLILHNVKTLTNGVGQHRGGLAMSRAQLICLITKSSVTDRHALHCLLKCKTTGPARRDMIIRTQVHQTTKRWLWLEWLNTRVRLGQRFSYQKWRSNFQYIYEDSSQNPPESSGYHTLHHNRSTKL